MRKLSIWDLIVTFLLGDVSDTSIGRSGHVRFAQECLRVLSLSVAGFRDCSHTIVDSILLQYHLKQQELISFSYYHYRTNDNGPDIHPTRMPTGLAPWDSCLQLAGEQPSMPHFRIIEYNTNANSMLRGGTQPIRSTIRLRTMWLGPVVIRCFSRVGSHHRPMFVPKLYPFIDMDQVLIFARILLLMNQ